LTLVEALAGTALLGTVLAAVLLADARLTRQELLARHRLEAQDAANSLLAAWWADRDTFPCAADGDVPNHDGWRWRTAVIPNAAAEELGADVVRLEIVDVYGDSPNPLAYVEVLVKRKESVDP